MIMLVLVCSMVLAGQGNGAGAAGAQASGDPSLISNQEQEKHMEQAQVTGLPNAQLMVRNEEQKQHLEQVMAKIQAQRAEVLNRLNELTFEEEDETGEITCEGKSEAKLLGLFKVQKSYQYRIREDGSVYRNRRWWEFMFQDDIEESG